MTQIVKNPPVKQETWVGSLGWEDPLEEGMAIYSSILAWRIPMDREAWQSYSPWGLKEWDTAKRLSTAQYYLAVILKLLDENDQVHMHLFGIC